MICKLCGEELKECDTCTDLIGVNNESHFCDNSNDHHIAISLQDLAFNLESETTTEIPEDVQELIRSM